MVIAGIYGDVLYFLKLTLVPEILWSVLPLAISTLIVLAYFQRYEGEREGWNGYLANALVLLFVSMSLLRYIYGLTDLGTANFIENQAKSITVLFLLLIGFILVRFDFEHILPERFARHLNSPLTINIVAYAVILFVYSPREIGINDFFALLTIVLLISLIFNSIKIPLKYLFIYVEEEKKKEELKDVKEQRFQIDELQRELKYRKKALKKSI